MENEDLIKKLEKIKFPQIEVPGHKNRLKMALINWKYRKKTKGFLGVLKRRLIPIGAVAIVVLLFLVTSNLIFPQYTFADAEKIAMKNPQIKEWIEKGAEIKDIKIIKNKAYVLISPKEEKTPSFQLSEEEMLIKKEREKFKGALAEIELKKEKVSEITEITPKIIPLTSKEKEKIEKMFQDLESLEKPAETIKIEKIEPIPVPVYRLELIKKDNKVEVLSREEEEKKARIIYEIGGEKKEGEINLTREEIEKIKVLEKEGWKE